MVELNNTQETVFAFIVLCLTIPGIIFLIKLLFTNKNIKLSNTELIFSKITLIILWISLVSSIKTFISLIYLIKNSILKLIVKLGIATYYLFMLYGLYTLTISIFEKDGGVYINNTDLTINCMRLAIIYGCISIPLFLSYHLLYPD